MKNKPVRWIIDRSNGEWRAFEGVRGGVISQEDLAKLIAMVEKKKNCFIDKTSFFKMTKRFFVNKIELNINNNFIHFYVFKNKSNKLILCELTLYPCPKKVDVQNKTLFLRSKIYLKKFPIWKQFIQDTIIEKFKSDGIDPIQIYDYKKRTLKK